MNMSYSHNGLCYKYGAKQSLLTNFCFLKVYVCMELYSFMIHGKTCLTDHLHISATPYIDLFIWLPTYHLYNTIVVIF